MYAKKGSGMKVVATLLAIALLMGVAIGGTLAWLMDNTNTVTNTFTVGDINIDLTENVNGTDKSAKEQAVSNDNFKIVPGTSQDKNPTVTVKENSEACWLFVEITESNNYTGTTPYITWSVDSAWTNLSETEKDGVKTYVYYIQHAATTDTAVPHSVLTNSKVSYSSDLTKAQLDVLGTNKPSLTFKAYAIQQVNGDGTIFTAETAWDELNK